MAAGFFRIDKYAAALIYRFKFHKAVFPARFSLDLTPVQTESLDRLPVFRINMGQDYRRQRLKHRNRQANLIQRHVRQPAEHPMIRDGNPFHEVLFLLYPFIF